MKCKHIIFTMAVLLLATAACENNRDNDLPGAKVCFLAEGLVESDPFYIVDEAPFVILRVFRSGYYKETATVSIRRSETALEVYNSENNTDYKALSEATYTIEPDRIALSGNKRSGEFKVVFDPMKLVEIKNLNDYVVPVELISDGNISTKRNTLLIHPNLEQIQVEIEEAGSVFYIAGENNYVNNVSNIADKTLTLKLARPFEAAGTVSLDCSQEALDAYNLQYGTSFRLAPEGVVTLSAEEFTIERGETTASATIHVDPSKLGNEPCAVPVRLTSGYFEVNPKKSIYLLHFAPTSMENYTPLNRYGWGIETTHYANTNDGSKMLDGQPGTYWDAPYNTGQTNPTGATAPPYDYTIDLRAATEICAVALQARASNAKRIGAGHIEVSPDNTNWAKVAEFDNAADTQDNANVGPFTYWFEPTQARFVRVTITKSNSEPNRYGFREVSVAETFVYAPSDTPGPQRLAQTNWSVDANSYHNMTQLKQLIDNVCAESSTSDNGWQAAYNPTTSATTEHLLLPFTLQIDMSSVQRIGGIEMWRRNNNSSIDDMKAGSFWISETGDSEDWKKSQTWMENGKWTKVGDFNFEKGISICRGPFHYMFPETQARYIRIHITESNNRNDTRDCASIAEIYAVR